MVNIQYIEYIVLIVHLNTNLIIQLELGGRFLLFQEFHIVIRTEEVQFSYNNYHYFAFILSIPMSVLWNCVALHTTLGYIYIVCIRGGRWP